MASKGKGKKEQVKSPPPVAEAEQQEDRDIVPGKITESDWQSLVSQEEGVDTVCSLVEEVFEVAFSIVNAHYLEKQAFPYTVQDAKKSLLKIIEWQFLTRDEGEKDTTHDPSWVEDEEPSSAVIDSWARGVVPQALETRLLSAMETADPVTVLSREAIHDNEDEEARPQTDNTTVSRTSRPSLSGTNKSSHKSSNQKTDVTHQKTRRSRPVARRPQARMVALEQAPVKENDEEENPDDQLDRDPSTLRSVTPTSFTTLPPSQMSHKRPMPFNMKPAQLAFQKGVTYDEFGNIVDMVKLDPKKFPSHVVKPRVAIVKPPPDTLPKHRRSLKTTTSTRDNQRDKFNRMNVKTTTRNASNAASSQTAGKHSQKVVLNAVGGESREGDTVSGGVGKLLPRGSKGIADKELTGTYSTVVSRESKRFPETLALPSLIDTIDPVQGVTIRESGRILHGPKRHKCFQPPSSPPRHKLRPIKPINTTPVTTTRDQQHSHYVAQTT